MMKQADLLFEWYSTAAKEAEQDKSGIREIVVLCQVPVLGNL